MEENNIEILIKNLFDNRHFKSYEQVLAFNEALDSLAILKNPDHLKVLFYLLDDDSDHPEVIDGVIHVIEYYGIDSYLPYMLIHLDEIYKQTPLQTRRMFFRILNSEKALIYLKKHMGGNCSSLETVLLQIEQQSERHKNLCKELIAELKNKTS